MAHRRVRVAWAIAALTAACLLVSVPLILLARDAPTYRPWTSLGSVGQFARLLPNIALLAFPIVGLLVASREPGNAIGWVILSSGLYSAAYQLDRTYAVYALHTRGPGAPGAVWAAWLQQSAAAPLALLVILFLFLFPNGRALSPRWSAWGRVLMVAALLLGTLGGALLPGPLGPFPDLGNPMGLDAEWPRLAFKASALVTAILAIIAVSSVIARFRRSTGVERQQMKWFLYAAVVNLVVLGPETAVYNLYPTGVPVWGQLAGIFAIVAMPAAVAIAILRYRLYDIDLLINRTLVYGALSAALVVTYAAFVILLQSALRPFTGGSELAVAASTLATLALVQPFRRRIQEAVDRRFYRARYDAVRTVDRFTSRLASEVDLDAVRADLLEAVTDTVQPAHASVWLRRQGS